MGEWRTRGWGIRLVALVALAGCDDEAPAERAPPDAARRRVGSFDAGGGGGDAGTLPVEDPCRPCAVGAQRCAGDDQFQVCERGEDGCTRWGEALLCPQEGQRCRGDGQCCAHECEAGAAPVCTPAGLRSCVDGPDGCRVLGPPEPCPGGAPCTPDGRCAEGCAEACTPGERRCAGAGAYEVCGEGTPECWRFSEPIPCPAGQECADGVCTGCIGGCDLPGPVCLDDRTRRACVMDERGCRVQRDEVCDGACVDGACVAGCDRCAAGAERCVGGTRQVCRRGGDGCLGWVDAGPCEAGCVDRCGPEGARTCSPDGRTTRCQRGPDGCLVEVDLGGCPPGARDCNDAGSYRICAADPEGCFRWTIHPCAEGVNCFAQPAACLGGCPGACEPGAVRCVDAERYEACELRDGCPAWVERPCAAGFDCVEQTAACAGRCPVRCEIGERQCVDGERFRTCVAGPDGCPAWEESPCAEGADCHFQREACFGACEPVCEVGARECAEGQRYRECTRGFDGCPEWTERFCRGFRECQESPAACFGDCDDACREGERRCDGDDGFVECVRAPGGCTEWVRRPCVDGEGCFIERDACFGACDHACEAGARRCAGDHEYEACEPDFSGCRRWVRRFCANGAECPARPEACYGACRDACTLGRNECLAGDRYRACVEGPDGCTVWEERPCAGGAECFQARALCFGECEGACEPGTRECLEGDRYRECVQGFDGCPEWVERLCFGIGDCATTPGACFGDCFNACEPGQVRCAGLRSWERCVVPADGGCTVWEEQPCAGDAQCFGDVDACRGG